WTSNPRLWGRSYREQSKQLRVSHTSTMTQSLLTGAIRTKFSVTGATMRRRHAETKQSLNTNFAAVCPAIHLRVRATAAKAEFGILHFSEVSVGPPVPRVNPGFIEVRQQMRSRLRS